MTAEELYTRLRETPGYIEGGRWKSQSTAALKLYAEYFAGDELPPEEVKDPCHAMRMKSLRDELASRRR